VFERILPAQVAVAVSREDIGAKAYPGEEAALGRAVEKRRREFLTGRACARRALAQLGIAPLAIPSGPRGEPQWPGGVVGSITHCAGCRAGAVARDTEVAALGIDAEVDAPLPNGLLADIALAQERRWIARLESQAPAVSWDRLLFSIKESVYKAWFPLTGRWLGFEDALVEVDRASGSFVARLRVEGPSLRGHRLRSFSGRWLAADGLLFASVALPAGAGALPAPDLAYGGEAGKNGSSR
jgi:4'-phosphopantetheinyl transferase EntD